MIYQVYEQIFACFVLFSRAIRIDGRNKLLFIDCILLLMFSLLSLSVLLTPAAPPPLPSPSLPLSPQHAVITNSSLPAFEAVVPHSRCRVIPQRFDPTFLLCTWIDHISVQIFLFHTRVAGHWSLSCDHRLDCETSCENNKHTKKEH